MKLEKEQERKRYTKEAIMTKLNWKNTKKTEQKRKRYTSKCKGVLCRKRKVAIAKIRMEANRLENTVESYSAY